MPNVHPILGGAGAAEVTHVQVAVGGRWENAARVHAADARASVATLASAIPERGESAVEIFARDHDGCVVFIGVRFVDRARSDLERVLAEVCNVALAKDGSLPRVVAALSRAVGAPLFEGDCSAIEVGVVDAWKSVPPVTLVPASGQHPGGTEAVLLEAAGRLLPPPGRVVAAEFAYGAPVPHWVAIEVARSSSEGVLVPSPSARVGASYLASLGALWTTENR